MVTRARDERGALEGFVLLALASLAGFAVIVAIAAALLVHRERVATAADMAALGAAQTGDCSIAQQVATHNGARVVDCDLTDAEARVVVAMPTGFSAALTRAGAPTEFRGVARAALAVAADPVAEQP